MNWLKSLKIGIIDRYIIRRFLGTFAFAIGMIIVIMVIFDAAEKMDDFLESHAPMSDIAIGYYMNFVPFFINQFSGLFTFIAVIFFTSKMAYDTEIIAILSSGVSFRRLMWPYFVSALIITTISLMMNMFIIPDANARRIAFELKYLGSTFDYNYKFEPHIYRQIKPGNFVYLRSFDAATHTAEYFALETYEDGEIKHSIEAQNAVFDSVTRRWKAPQYIERTFEGERETFTKGSVPLDTAIMLESNELGRVQDLMQTLNSIELSKFIEQQKAKGSDMVAIFQVENASRYAYPLSTFILTLIGVSLSSRKVRGGTGLHIGVGIVLCFSYIVLMRFVGEFAKSGALPPIIGVWMPNILYLIVGIYLYRKAPK